MRHGRPRDHAAAGADVGASPSLQPAAGISLARVPDEVSDLKALTPDLYMRLTKMERAWADGSFRRWTVRLAKRHPDERQENQRAAVRRAYQDATLNTARASAFVLWVGIGLQAYGGGRLSWNLAGIPMICVGAILVAGGFLRSWLVGRAVRASGWQKGDSA